MGKLSTTGPALDSSVLTHRIPRQACEESGSVWAALKAEVWCRLARRKQGWGVGRVGQARRDTAGTWELPTWTTGIAPADWLRTVLRGGDSPTFAGSPEGRPGEFPPPQLQREP